MENRGFTLIELIIVLGIGTIVLSLAYPSFNNLIERLQTTSRVNGLIGMVRFARESAVIGRRWITLCPTLGETCSNSRNWHTGIMVFADRNRDGARQPDEAIVAYQGALDPDEQLSWRSFRQRNFLQFRPEGYTNWQNGSFHYCPASGDPRNGKVVIVNIQGRAAVSVDSNGDGIDEQANGQPLAC